MFNYLFFLLKSSNQHGLHSPFVYNYLTKGLYEAKNLSESKQLNWIFKSIYYFQPKKIYVCNSLKNELSEYNSILTESVFNADLILITNQNENVIDDILDKIDANQILFIINKKYSPKLQSSLRQNREIVLLIDFYVGSLISKRTEQLKQNFFLRL